MLPLSIWSQGDIISIVADSIQILDQVYGSSNIEINNRNSNNTLLGSLENQSFAAIRSGGPSVLSTIIHRGMASRHISVLWAGFNIQSIVNGTFDLGLISNTFDRVRFYKNGTSAVTGNASIAGAFSLGNDVFKRGETRINVSYSSAKNKSVSVVSKLRHNKYYHHLAFNLISNENQYSFINNGLKLTQTSAAFSMWDFNYEGHLVLSEKFSLNGGGWLQKADRIIPPTKTSVAIKQEQKDSNYRGFVQLSYYLSDQSRIKLRSAYFDETIEYQAPGIFSLANADILNFAIDYINDGGLNVSAQYRRDVVNASFFQPVHDRNTMAFLVDWSTSYKSYEVGASIRPEWVDNSFQPLVIGLRLKKDLMENLSSTFKYNKGYTLPSFNDLYWPIGGNPNLKTERSQEFDIGLDYKFGKTKNSLLNVNLFLNVIDDWIQWTPKNGFFQPINQRKVRNIGLELKLTQGYQLSSDKRLKLEILYAFTDSRLLKHYLNSDNDGKRSIFVPAHKITGQISFSIKSWNFHLKPLFYSKRYDTVDNSSFVPGFFIIDLEAVKKIKINNSDLHLSLGIDNGLNNDYENIRFYPMPLRVLRIGAKFIIK